MLSNYLSDVAKEMRLKSASLRRDFASHRLSGGENREDLVRMFLANHLPRRFGVATGMVISSDGPLSNQADLLIVDSLNNAPLYPTASNQLWPAEAVYALVEVKTNLSPSELSDCISKCRRFKALQRRFSDAGNNQRIRESLFVVWGFDCATPSTFKASLGSALDEIPRSEQPDLVIVPDKVVARCGSYLELSKLGQPNSLHRKQLQQTLSENLYAFAAESMELLDLRENSLLAGFVWIDSWLRQAGSRLADPVTYIPPNQLFGRKV